MILLLVSLLVPCEISLTTDWKARTTVVGPSCPIGEPSAGLPVAIAPPDALSSAPEAKPSQPAPKRPLKRKYPAQKDRQWKRLGR